MQQQKIYEPKLSGNVNLVQLENNNNNDDNNNGNSSELR